MAPAVYDTIRVDVLAGLPGAAEKPYLFRATGSTLKFPGFLAVYSDVKDEDDTEEDDQNRAFPKLAAGVPLDLLDLLADQHFTQPPPRYTEASLVKALEEYGIGRPSTYAPIMNTIQQRGYVTRDGKRLAPSATGAVVNDLLVEHFPDIVDLNFTARMEEDLDEIAAGDKEWVPVVREFYEPFKRELEWAKSNVPGVELAEERIGRECPESGHDLVIRWGRFGKFIGCSNYPTCKYTEPLFELVGVTCPKCREGEIAERKTRKNRTFYGCTRYPDCDWTSWKRPLRDPCPNCGNLLYVQNKDWAACETCQERYKLDSFPSHEQPESA
jgi:DNA topoisomerase-1